MGMLLTWLIFAIAFVMLAIVSFHNWIFACVFWGLVILAVAWGWLSHATARAEREAADLRDKKWREDRASKKVPFRGPPDKYNY